MKRTCNYDVAIIGAGPAGCATALSLSNQGAKVLLLEANPDAAAKRLAGEWLHPPAVEMLKRLGVEMPVSSQVGRGFVVYPDDKSASILMPYSRGSFGYSFEHHEFVDALRDAVKDSKGVAYIPWARAVEVSTGKLIYQHRKTKVREEVCAETLIGADGRASKLRGEAGGLDDRQKISHVVGFVLKGVWLPHEGYGHVFVGPPGPILAYRIAPGVVRVILDIPLKYGRPKDPEWLISNYVPWLSEDLQAAAVESLRDKRFATVPVQVQNRRYYGKPRMRLVGDAVGYYHPLTAAGMTLSCMDASALRDSSSHEDYALRRTRETRVPEVLATLLYEVFADESAEMKAMRQAVYSNWRRSSSERQRTMRLLACQDTSLTSFLYSFSKVSGLAGLGIVRSNDGGDLMARAKLMSKWFSKGIQLASGLRTRSVA